jgi:hypothetical protein
MAELNRWNTDGTIRVRETGTNGKDFEILEKAGGLHQSNVSCYCKQRLSL